MDTNLLYPLFLFLSFLLIAFKFSTRKHRKLPPSPKPALPLLGHIHLLKLPLIRTYAKLSEKLGPIFSLQLGSRFTVVVSSPAIAEECFTKNDIVLADRPRIIIGKYVFYDFTALSAASYGDHWRNLRRLTTIEVLSNVRLNTFDPIRKDEIRILLQRLCRKSQFEFTTVKLRTMLKEMTFNNIMRMVAGKRYFGEEEDNKEEAREFRELIDEVFRLGGASNLADLFPIFRWIDYNDHQKNLKRVGEKMDAFLQGLIDEKRRNKGVNNMIDHLLSLQESDPEYYSDTIIKGIITVMLIAGTDTSSLTVEWAMSALLNHPEKLERARAEVENITGKDRLVNESDASKLPYLQNIISETFRLFPAVPLLVPHEASADCTLGGYDIPRGTILVVNTWAIHRDPTVWDDPMSFKPERFEAGEVVTPKLMPFGMGRRSCPGESLARRVVSLTLSSLIQGFEWRRVDEALVDLTEGPGTSMPKAVPLEAMCKAREVLKQVLTASD